jgi:hypothetical protein
MQRNQAANAKMVRETGRDPEDVYQIIHPHRDPLPMGLRRWTQGLMQSCLRKFRRKRNACTEHLAVEVGNVLVVAERRDRIARSESERLPNSIPSPMLLRGKPNSCENPPLDFTPVLLSTCPST